MLPLTAASPDGDILRLQEWLFVRGISVGENAGSSAGKRRCRRNRRRFRPGHPGGMRDLRGRCRTAECNRRCGVLAGTDERHADSLDFQPAQPTIADAVVETAARTSRPPSARGPPLHRWRSQGAGQLGSVGPRLLPRLFRPMVPGAASQWVEAGLRRARPAAAVPSRWGRISPLYVPSIVRSASRNNRLVAGASPTPVPAGSFFFVRGMLDGSPSHIHVGVTISETRPDGRFELDRGQRRPRWRPESVGSVSADAITGRLRLRPAGLTSWARSLLPAANQCFQVNGKSCCRM